MLPDEVDDLLHGGPGQKYPAHADLLEFRDIDAGNDAADDHENVVQTFLLEQRHDAGTDMHVGAGQHRQPYHVRILLKGRRHDLLGRLPQACVNDLHTCVAQGACDDPGATVVPIESGLGDYHANFRTHFDNFCSDRVPDQITGTSSYSPHTSRSASHISPTVA